MTPRQASHRLGVLGVVLVLMSAAVACRRQAVDSNDAAKTAVPMTTAPAVPKETTSKARETIVFLSADGWKGSQACTDVRTEDGCDSQWQHDSGQLLRVFVVDVKAEEALDTFVDRLATDVIGRGGVVDRFTQNGLTLVRFVEAVPASSPADAGIEATLASLNYALVGRDRRAIHLMTSIVPLGEQEVADARLRSLLESAHWTVRETPAR